MGDEINVIVVNGIKITQQGWIAGLLDCSTLAITIYVMYYGYLVFAGKVQEPFWELVWYLARFAIVIGMLQGMGTYLTLVTDAVHGLRGFLVGNENSSSNAYAGINL